MIAKLDSLSIKTDQFCEALLELHNTPGSDGRSPNMIVFGRNLRSLLPVHHSAFDLKWQQLADKADAKRTRIREQTEAYYNDGAHPLKPLRVGTRVRIQDHVSKRWEHLGEIVGVGEHRKYRIKLPSGRTWWRNRRFLRQVNADIEEDENDDERPSPSDAEDDTETVAASQDDDDQDQAPRRSSRPKKKPERYGVSFDF